MAVFKCAINSSELLAILTRGRILQSLCWHTELKFSLSSLHAVEVWRLNEACIQPVCVPCVRYEEVSTQITIIETKEHNPFVHFVFSLGRILGDGFKVVVNQSRVFVIIFWIGFFKLSDHPCILYLA